MSESNHYLFEDIGSFDLTQPIMRVSDPCYEKDVWCSLTLPNCKTGTWVAAVAYVDSDSWGRRVAALTVRHADGPSSMRFMDTGRLPSRPNRPMYDIKMFNEEAGVDSGQCGFFDDKFFGDDDVCKNMTLIADYGNPWYNMCCDATSDGNKCGIVPYGAVSCSGVGDGGYPLFYIEKDGRVVAAMLQFIEPEK